MGAGKRKNVPGVACSVDGGKTVVIDILLCWFFTINRIYEQGKLKSIRGKSTINLETTRFPNCKVLF